MKLLARIITNPASFILAALCGLCLCLTGCGSAPQIPPGSAVSWTHVGSYGPWQSSITATGIEKQGDGTFKVSHYDGKAGWLGFGVHDVIEGLIINAPAPAPAASIPPPVVVVPLSTNTTGK